MTDPNGQKKRSRLFIPLIRSCPIRKGARKSSYGKFIARYYKDEGEAKTLIHLEVEENQKVFESENNTVSTKTYYKFTPDSIKEISCDYRSKGFFDVHLRLKKLPERFSWYLKKRERQIIRINISKILSETWTESVLMSSIHANLCVRIRGYPPKRINPRFKKFLLKGNKISDKRTKFLLCELLQKEFKRRYNKKGPGFQRNRYDIEEEMMEDLHKNIAILERRLSKLPFVVSYSFMCLFSTKRIHFLNFSLQHYKDTIKWLKDTCDSSPCEWVYRALEYSMKKITSAARARQNNKKNLLEMIQQNFERAHTERGSNIIDLIVDPSKLVKIRIVSITPSRIELDFGTLSIPNRAIRDHFSNIDNFIRVRFLNENGQRGVYWGGSQNDWILFHIENIMLDGFCIGSKRFKFLHFSNSQVKSHSCWFMNEVPGELSYDTFIKSLGDFSGEKSIFKGIARRGQAFSSSVATQNLDINQEIIEDSDIERNGYTFSYGCGEIDKEFFEEKVLKQYFKHSMCSAIQIRMGGYKGVLLATNNLSDGVKIKTRKSMNKFDLPEGYDVANLEVIRLATYMSGYLNKQIILVMWSNGIDEEVFIKIQKSYISTLLSYYNLENLDKDSKYPVELYQSFCIIERKLSEMYINGEDFYQDPFIEPIIKRICLNRLRDVRKKFRILDKFSCNLIGVIDPYDCLEEGEVFFQFNERTKYRNEYEATNTKLVNGKVLVTRSPCVHPGDLRILTAVDEPKLYDMVNVIVFSAKGERPDQHKMGSGDLDGDIYWINWRLEFVYNFLEKKPYIDDPELLDQILEPKSMIVQPSRTNTSISREKCINAFLDYLRKDILGQIASLHLRVGDLERDNLEKQDCKILAKMHCIAVDSAKNDYQISIAEFMKLKLEYDFVSDFMFTDREPPHDKVVIPSPGILGILHREIKIDVNNEELHELEYKTKILKEYPLSQKFFEDDDICKHLAFLYLRVVVPYNSFVKNLLLENNIVSEGDLFNSTCEFSNLASSRDDSVQIHQSLSILFEKVKEEYKQIIKNYQLKNFITIGAGEVKQQDIAFFEIHPKLSFALKFLAYFNHSHYFQAKTAFNNPDFDYFWLLYCQETVEPVTPISYKDYKKIAKSTYNEEDELSLVLSQSQIFSSWWLLTS
ncbi:unnamed protein product [Moneuplotes crassus]|uniref:RNA-dependent RNA polymerase n=1 Tax=Euplotes crassus TaxID=5936 RepID=A0AAD1UM66_EUPCR|nr:unnamed protein product [Moneuplotes crassus]